MCHCGACDAHMGWGFSQAPGADAGAVDAGAGGGESAEAAAAGVDGSSGAAQATSVAETMDAKEDDELSSSGGGGGGGGGSSSSSSSVVATGAGAAVTGDGNADADVNGDSDGDEREDDSDDDVNFEQPTAQEVELEFCGLVLTKLAQVNLEPEELASFAAELDAIAAHRPLYVQHVMQLRAILNSLPLVLAGQLYPAFETMYVQEATILSLCSIERFLKFSRTLSISKKIQKKREL